MYSGIILLAVNYGEGGGGRLVTATRVGQLDIAVEDGSGPTSISCVA